jgi:hypothetical protein
MSYTQVFGGNTIFPSDVSYLRLDIDADVVLDWPLENEGATPAARIIDLAPTGPGFSVTLPIASQTGTGQTLLFNNLGPDVVSVLDQSGNTILSLTAGSQWQIYLVDNTTTDGVWRVFRYGAATAQAQASALAGFGLLATGSTLSQQYPVLEFSSNFAAAAANRAATLVWTGASGTLSFPSAGVAGSGWFVNVRNAGAGDLLLQPNGVQLINGAPSLSLRPGDSAVIISNGSGWYTVGLGQDAVFAFDYTSIDLTGQPSPYVLQGSELNRIAYQFVGTLTANMEIVVPPTIQQYWVANNTTGAFSLGVRTPSQVVPFDVAPASRAILYSDGATVVNAATAGIAFPIPITAGGTGATSANAALVNLGGTADGIAIFTAASTADIWTTLGPAPAGTVDGGVF